MKRISLLLSLTLLLASASAKKVKFAVDMRGVPIDPTGMHISGDFQDEAGFPGGDWSSNSTPLTIEAADSIYSIVVDIPAFSKYEYKFLNGDQFYNAEFVPVESRIGYAFNDNRWLYVDSIADDTTFVGAIRFAGNAPMNKYLLRLVVNMSSVPLLDPSGVYVAGSFQNWNTQSDILYSFVPGVWEKICYVDAGTHEYKFYNGYLSSGSEIVPSTCAVNGNREITVSADIIPPTYCFSECAVCNTGIDEINGFKSLQISPNPMNELAIIRSGDERLNAIVITDVSGRKCFELKGINTNEYVFEKNALTKGVYFIRATDISENVYCNKLIIE